MAMNVLNHFGQYAEETLVNMASVGSLEAFNQMVLIHYLRIPLWLRMPHRKVSSEPSGGMKAFHGGWFRGWLLKPVTNSA